MMKKELSPKQQAVELIKNNQNFLIIPHANPDGDAVASALALKLVLEKMEKNADVAIPDDIPADYSFLPGADKILREKKINRDLVINLKNKVGKISYDKKSDGTIDLIITPAKDEIDEGDITLNFGRSNYEVVIVLDTPNKERANEFFENNRAFLDTLPTINIDHHPTNNIFGSVNIVDTTATSTCEIIFSLIEALDKNLIDENIATLLLTGIISDTNRFQNANTTPKSLTVAAQLIASGANRSGIVKNMFRTKAVPTLKLWGEILSNIKEDKEKGIVWSTISFDKMNEIGADHTSTEGVIDELMSSASGARLVLLFNERKPGLITVSMRTLADDVALDEFSLIFGGGGHRKAAGFKLEGISLSEAENMVLSRVRSFLGGNTSSAPKIETSIKNNSKPVAPNIVTKPKTSGVKKPSISDVVSEDDFYAPSISDIDLDKPKIVEEKTSILQKLVEDKKKKQDTDRIDFAKLEQEIRRKNNPADYIEDEKSKVANDDDWDEDYE